MNMATQKDNLQSISKLRELTGAGILSCKQALTESGGDIKKAQDIIRAKGLDIAKKKADRETKEGQVFTYIHTGGKLGVMVEINCETDFVARSEDFCRFTRDLAMHIAAMNPADVQGLLQQPFVKDPGKSIQDLLNELVAKIGENTIIGRFVRFKVGE